MKYYHTACGGVAFESTKQFKSGDVMYSKYITVNGKQVEPGQLMVCGNCGKQLKHNSNLTILNIVDHPREAATQQ